MSGKKEEEVMTGTTIMAIKINNGVIIGADSRTSLGTYIPSRFTDKLTPLTDYIYCCRSGSSADTQAIAKLVSNKLLEIESINEKKVSVAVAAKLASTIISDNPTLLAGLILAGYDDKGPSIFSVNLGGATLEREWAIGGSGSGYIYGYCDSNFKSGMTLEEGIQFVKNAVTHAIKRDNHSGGCVRMAFIGRDGVQRYFSPVN